MYYNHIFYQNDEPVKGVGKSVKDLIQLGVLLNDQVLGSTNGDLIRVPIENEMVNLEMNIAYLAKEDKYVKYESFTDKTLIGARYLTLKDGRKVNNKGRTMKSLVKLGAIVSEEVLNIFVNKLEKVRNK